MSSKRFKNLSDTEVWDRWHERIHRIRHELHFVFNTRQKFRIVADMFENNGDLRAIGGDVQRWMFRMWAWDAIMAVRREMDPDSNTVSLRCMLDEMVERPQVLTRRRYLGPIEDQSDFRWQMLWQTFNDYGVIPPRTRDEGSLDDYLDPAGIQVDRIALENACGPVIKVANRMVAHRTPIEEVPLTFKQLNDAIDSFEPVFVKYYAIVRGPSLDGLEPSIIGDWSKPFYIPWAKPWQPEQPSRRDVE